MTYHYASSQFYISQHTSSRNSSPQMKLEQSDWPHALDVSTVRDPESYPQLKLEQSDWPHALDISNDRYPERIYDNQHILISPTYRPPFPSIPIYTASYSLASAMTPVVESNRPPLLPRSDTTTTPAAPSISDAENGTVYDPDSTASTRSPRSPSSPRKRAVNNKYDTESVKASCEPSQAWKEHRAESVHAPRGSQTRGHEAPTDGDVHVQTVDLSYTCDACGSFFERRYDGERHYRSHTGARPFRCYGGCNKAFRRADARSRHWAVYRGCELQHMRYIKGTPEGLRIERLTLKRQTRAELVAQGVPRRDIERILRKL